jgi:hypothetical protein
MQQIREVEELRLERQQIVRAGDGENSGGLIEEAGESDDPQSGDLADMWIGLQDRGKPDLTVPGGYQLHKPLVDGTTKVGEIYGECIQLDARAIQQWWDSGAPIQNRGDLVHWNILCRTAQRRPGRRVTPEALAVVVKFAWLEYENPCPTDATILGAHMGMKKATWLHLVADARSEVARVAGPSRQLVRLSSFERSDIGYLRRFAKRANAAKAA